MPLAACQVYYSYFPQSELLCPEDADQSFPVDGRHRLDRRGNVDYECGPILEKYNQTVSDLRAAGIEYLFGKVSRFVQEVGTRQLNAVFGHIDSVPSNLITVHLRWGDKGAEMSLVPVEAYIEAIESILANRAENTKLHDGSVNIFLATEDPAAVEAFMEAAPPDWNLYVDQYFRELLEHRKDGYNGNPKMAQTLQGEPGLQALGSLLVAMEANDFVLTTASNWSRLMNEIRKTILEGKCPGCTNMIDLQEGEW